MQPQFAHSLFSYCAISLITLKKEIVFHTLFLHFQLKMDRIATCAIIVACSSSLMTQDFWCCTIAANNTWSMRNASQKTSLDKSRMIQVIYQLFFLRVQYQIASKLLEIIEQKKLPEVLNLWPRLRIKFNFFELLMKK